ncbi:MAG TPA: 6-phosphogluconolactonase [Thermoanaerobaculia bacterium]|nr:6-phosphogluconolactonase [Thermoanaerobaculia bacterium]
MNFRIFDSIEELVQAAAATLVAYAEKSDSITVALSGGTTPKSLYELLGKAPLRDRLARRKITWVTGDERCVPPDDAQSNRRMIEESLFREGISEGHRFIKFRTELNEPATIANHFNAEWNDLAVGQIDLAILGMGEDGHTASLFPGTPVLDVVDQASSEVWVPRLESWRVTLTTPQLRDARCKWVLAAGAGKKSMIERIRRGEDFPITSVAEKGTESWWFVDRAAYPGVS